MQNKGLRIIPKKTHEEIAALLQERGLFLLKYENANNVHYMDKNGYKYKSSIDYIVKRLSKDRLPKTFLQRNIYAKENLIKYVKDNYPKIILEDFVYSKGDQLLPFICANHPNFGVQYKTPIGMIECKEICAQCAFDHRNDYKRATSDEVKEVCEKLGLEYVGEGKGPKGTVACFICPKHRNKGEQKVDLFRLKKASHGCKYCAGKERTLNDIVEYIIRTNSTTRIIQGTYAGELSKLKCVCIECGHIWCTTPHDIINGRKCPSCSRREAGLKKRLTHEEFLEKLERVQPNVIILSKYETQQSLMKCKCKNDGCEWETTATNLLTKNTGCPSCRSSSNEYAIRMFLVQNGYEVRAQYRFKGCKDKHTLPFDMYIPELNLAIEYDGEIHYYPIPYRGRARVSPEIAFAVTQKHDKIKNEFCKNNGIHLIRVPYWEKKNYKEFLQESFDVLGFALPKM